MDDKCVYTKFAALMGGPIVGELQKSEKNHFGGSDLPEGSRPSLVAAGSRVRPKQNLPVPVSSGGSAALAAAVHYCRGGDGHAPESRQR